MRIAIVRRIQDLIRTELLGRAADGRPRADNALFEAMPADPRSARVLLEAPASAAAATTGSAMGEVLAACGGTRTAAGEVSTACLSLGVGGMAFGKVTPGVIGAEPRRHPRAPGGRRQLPLGATLGGIWHGRRPGLVVGLVVALALASASLPAFAGVVSDPVQRHLGVRRRRLHRMLDVLEANLRGPSRESLAVKDYYVARLLDLLDCAAAAARYVRAG
jgi:hypothetical protein